MGIVCQLDWEWGDSQASINDSILTSLVPVGDEWVVGAYIALPNPDASIVLLGLDKESSAAPRNLHGQPPM